MKILHVALFENRHNWPKSVTDSVFPEKHGGYDPRDFSVFEGIATIKFLQWKSSGVEVINLYLSGLTAATIAALNAAYSVGIYVRLFHYSATINQWLLQPVEFLPAPKDLEVIEEQDRKNMQEEETVKETISDANKHILTEYVNIFNKLYTHYDPDRFLWDDVYEYIKREYSNLNDSYLQLMKPYFTDFKEKKEGSYPDELRERIDYDTRIGKRIQAPIKSSDNRRNRRRGHKNSR